MQKPSEIVILGSGSSINEGISLGLKDALKDRFVIACNYSFSHFYHTFLACIDKEFYHTTDLTKHPDISEQLKKEPLIISCMKPTDDLVVYPNTILVKKSNTYHKDPINNGFLWTLCGLFALQLAELFKPEKIFLLGFDWDRRTDLPERNPNYNPYSDLDIHYYKKEIAHKGSSYMGYYENHNPNNYFKWFNNSNIKIYNVSLKSNIENFEKINYLTMFKLMSNVRYNQKKLRKNIIEIIL